MLKIYNTLTGKKEILKPLGAPRDKKLRFFVCGPTVYDSAHIGHARTYIAFDMAVKYLRERGYDVFYLQNITDIDDKIIARALEGKITPKELALKFEKEYLEDMAVLGINSVTKYARATDHIKEILSQVQSLLEGGFAYPLQDGVYFDISKFKDYGKLSKRSVLQAEDAVSRIDESKEKKNRGDFCLWKYSKKGEPSWPSPWGAGRPGWHIEDTAIGEKYLGQQYDIHGGGRDLAFPHHEAEIAQMETISGKRPFIKYWMHTGFLTISGQKMSKSLKNFVTIKDFLKEHRARELRLFVIKTHYRSPIDYSRAEMESVKSQLKRIDEFTGKLGNIVANLNVKTEKKIDSLAAKTEKKFFDAMDDDFNSPKALAALFDFMKEINRLFDRGKIDSNSAKELLSFLREIDAILGFLFSDAKKEIIPADVAKLASLRERYRKEGRWQKADRIRAEMKEKGYEIKDVKEGSEIVKI